MSKTPPIPHGQRNEKLHGGKAPPARPAVEHGNADMNLKEQGGPGNLHQNLSQPHNLRGR